MEQQLGDDREAIKKKQSEFRQRTDEFFAKSFFMQRARTWPQGYPGDYEIIEKAYNNQPLSPGCRPAVRSVFPGARPWRTASAIAAR